MGKFSLGIPAALFLVTNVSLPRNRLVIARSDSVSTLHSQQNPADRQSQQINPHGHSQQGRSNRTLAVDRLRRFGRGISKIFKPLILVGLAFLTVKEVLNKRPPTSPPTLSLTSPNLSSTSPPSPVKPGMPLTLSPPLSSSSPPLSSTFSPVKPGMPVTLSPTVTRRPQQKSRSADSVITGPVAGQTVAEWLQSISEGGVPKLQEVLSNCLQEAGTEAEFPELQHINSALESLEEETKTLLEKKKGLVRLMELSTKKTEKNIHDKETQERISTLVGEVVDDNWDLAKEEKEQLEGDLKALEKLIEIFEKAAEYQRIEIVNRVEDGTDPRYHSPPDWLEDWRASVQQARANPAAGPVAGQAVVQWLRSILEGGVLKLEAVLVEFVDNSIRRFPGWLEKTLRGEQAGSKIECARFKEYLDEQSGEAANQSEPVGCRVIASLRVLRLKELIDKRSDYNYEGQAAFLRALSDDQIRAILKGEQFSNYKEFISEFKTLKKETKENYKKKIKLFEHLGKLKTLNEVKPTQEDTQRTPKWNKKDALRVMRQLKFIKSVKEIAQREITKAEDLIEALETLKEKMSGKILAETTALTNRTPRTMVTTRPDSPASFDRNDDLNMLAVIEDEMGESLKKQQRLDADLEELKTLKGKKKKNKKNRKRIRQLERKLKNAGWLKNPREEVVDVTEL